MAERVPMQLYRVAAQLAAEGRVAAAIKCLLAAAASDPLPDDAEQVAFALARLYIAHTTNLSEARQVLNSLLLATKDAKGRVATRCQCWSLLMDAELACGRGAAAMEPCSRGMDEVAKHSPQMEQPNAWWVHFASKAAEAARAGVPGALEAVHRACAELGGDEDPAARALAQVRMAEVRVHWATGDWKAAQAAVAEATNALHRLPRDDRSTHTLLLQAEALTVQALHMLACGSSVATGPLVCPPLAEHEDTAAEPGARRGRAGEATLAAVRAELEARVQLLQEAPAATGAAHADPGAGCAAEASSGGVFLAAVTPVMGLLRALDCLAQHSGGTDPGGASALQHARDGLTALNQLPQLDGGPLGTALRALLLGVAVLFRVTAGAASDADTQLLGAQEDLAQLQALVSQPLPQRDRELGGAGVLPFAHHCTAVTALAAGEVAAACAHWERAWQGLTEMQESARGLRERVGSASAGPESGPQGGPPDALSLFQLLLALSSMQALSRLAATGDGSEGGARANATATTLPHPAEPEDAWERLAAATASLAAAAAEPGGRRPKAAERLGATLGQLLRAHVLDGRAASGSGRSEGGGGLLGPQREERKACVLEALKQSQRLQPNHPQLLVYVLKVLGVVLVTDGDTCGGERAFESALQLMSKCKDPQARVQVLQEFGRLCFAGDAAKMKVVDERLARWRAAAGRARNSELHGSLMAWDVHTVHTADRT